jgi:WD40 repeat protein
MAINVETGERSTGSYIPPHGNPPRDIGIVVNLFTTILHFSPNSPVLSPDGTMLAAADQNGFVTLYHLTRSYDQLMADEANAAATRQAEAPRSLGLLPSPTPSFEYAGQGHPTLTPTVSPTAPPEPQSTLDSQTGAQADICPASKLSSLDAPPPGYSASGRLFVPPVDAPRVVWVLRPDNGHLYPDDRLPLCSMNGNCRLSFDRQWMLNSDVGLTVSHPDGSQPILLYTLDEKPVWPQSIDWEGEHILTYSYQGYLPDHRGALTLVRTFDPTTNTLSAPVQPPEPPQIFELPTSVVSAQPNDGALLLVSTPYPNASGGAKFYIFDQATGQADYFARSDSGSLDYQWHPLGKYLYYRLPGDPMWYVFNTQTRQFGILGNNLPAQDGVWSPDGRYTANWYDLPLDEFGQQIGAGESLTSNSIQDSEASQRIAVGQRLPKIAIWDSETNQTQTYCLPESGTSSFSGTPIVWSPDGRYLAFTIPLSPAGDDYLTPTPLPDTPVPVPTDIPLETQFQYQNPRTLVLDVQTGYATIISTEIVNGGPILWTDDGGAQ